MFNMQIPGKSESVVLGLGSQLQRGDKPCLEDTVLRLSTQPGVRGTERERHPSKAGG